MMRMKLMGRKLFLLFVTVAVLVTTAPAQERVNLPSGPVSLKALSLDYEAEAVTIRFVTPGGAQIVSYGPNTIPTGATLLRGLNKADLSSVSLERRVYQRLIDDGYLTGTITGTPKL